MTSAIFTPGMKTGERTRAVLDVIARDGRFLAGGPAELNTCMRLHVRGFLDRDRKNHMLFTLSARGQKTAAIAGKGDAQPAVAADVPAGARVCVSRSIDSIETGKRLRPVDAERVTALMVSIRELGLRTPISVFGAAGDATVMLSAGGHRLEAMRALGESTIDCFHESGDALDAELWEIDENLARAELTAADRALFLFRRKEIYLLKHPETAQHLAGARARHGAASDKLSFAESTAQATGQTRRTVERDTERGARICDMALHHIRGTRLDSGVFLDRLKQVPEERQVLYVKAALEEEKRKAADTKENRRRLSEVRHAVRLAHMAHITQGGTATAGKLTQKFPVIYADPPWRFGVYSEVTGRDKSPENHYPTMSTPEIMGLFEEIGSPAKEDSVLFLWATNPMLPDGMKVLEAWGFTYVHHWVWDKEVAGTGYWGRDCHEILLIGKRGKPVAPLPGTQPNTVFRERKTAHSSKPSHYGDVIDAIFPGVPKLELFSRNARPGWTGWGFEAQDSGEAA
jgi:N6-adenosine-specific RNA methylase IME4